MENPIIPPRPAPVKLEPSSLYSLSEYSSDYREYGIDIANKPNDDIARPTMSR